MADSALHDVMAGDYAPVYRREGDLRIYEFPKLHVTFRFSRMSMDSKETRAWMEVQSNYPGDPRRLMTGQVNVLGPNARRDIARNIKERSLNDTVDWPRILEEAFVALIEQDAEGSPTVLAYDIAPRTGSRFRIEPLSFEKLPVIWFGKGGSGKSLTALAAAISMQGDVGLLPLPLVPGPVLYCDWELDQESWGEEVRLLCAGMGLRTPGIHYRQCMTPLHHEAEAIGRYIAREGIQTVIIDSLGAACGAGNKNDQDVATRMMTAIRSWTATPICIDHIGKAESTNTPYGSVYFETSARATWRFKGAVHDDVHYVSATIEKSNLGRYDPVHLKFTFSPSMKMPEAIYCEPALARELPPELRTDLANNMTRVRTALVMAREMIPVDSIVEACPGLSEQTVRATLDEMVRSGEVRKQPIRGGATKYMLQSSREAS